MLEPQSAFEAPWQRQHLRVPREDQTIFARPPFAEAAACIEKNAEILCDGRVNIQGRTLRHMREWTRRAVLESALEYTSLLAGETVALDDSEYDGIVADGHQPSLFHPGVWVKNFGIAALANATNRIPLHLVVDNDTLSTSAIRVPGGDRKQPGIETIPFDDDRRATPWEEAAVQNLALFRSFGDRTAAAMRRWGIEPLVSELWPDAVEFAETGRNLPDCLTGARHRLERRWGLANLELPLSRLGSIDPFLWFASHLFAHAPRFREVHNEVLTQYRRINRIRSRTHPVPELALDGEWTETPFWLWQAGDQVRRQVFVRQAGKEMELTDRRDVTVRFPLSPAMDACCAVEVLRELPQRGIRLRTRALTTTLFARLCLADLFVHGIGGSKYDEMTDRIIARFFEMPTPEFLTLSATVHLPLAEPFDVTADDIRQLHHELRDVGYNPDRHLDAGAFGDAKAQKLVAEKRRLIDEQQSATTTGLSRSQRRARRAENHRRYRRFQKIDRQLQRYAESTREELRSRNDALQAEDRANAVLRNREFAFCLYPEETLRPFYEAGIAGRL